MKPYVVPAMGSHGGATVEGQREILAGMGVTEEAIGVEIRATMEVVEIGRIPNGPAVCQGKDSITADHSVWSAALSRTPISAATSKAAPPRCASSAGASSTAPR